MKLNVYVPRAGNSLAFIEIDRGSGVVGTPNTLLKGHVLVDYEGNRFGAQNIVTWLDRVMVAAGRHEARYPTKARMHVPEEDLTLVGTFDTAGNEFALAEDQSAQLDLAAWLGSRELLRDELRLSQPNEWR